jgi:hypothetical protein
MNSLGTCALLLFSLGLSAAALAQPGNRRSRNVGWGEVHRFEFEYRRWRPELGSDLEVGGGPIYPGSDLGLGEERQSEYRGFLRFSPAFKLRASYLPPLQYEGETAIARPLEFAGQTYPAQATLTTTMELEHTKGGIEVDFFRSRDGYLGVIGEYSRFQASPVLSSPSSGRASRALRVALPTVGLVGRVYLTPRLSLTAEASGMKWVGRGGVITDLEGVATIHASPRLGLSGGYRNLYARVADNGDRGAFRLKGWFFSVAVRI